MITPKRITQYKSEITFKDSLDKHFCVTTIGPGFGKINEFEMQLERYLSGEMYFDLVVLDIFFYFYTFNEKTYINPRQLTSFKFNSKKYFKNISDSKCLLIECNINILINNPNKPTFVYLASSDCYAYSIDRIKKMVESTKNIYFLCPRDLDTSLPLSDFPYAKYEDFFETRNNYFFDYMNDNPEKIISLPHMIGNHEFFEFGKKRLEWVVPGAPYYHRKKIRNYLINAGIKCPNTTYINKCLLLFIGFLHLPSQFLSHKFIKDVYYNEFRDQISKSWCTYTCGSGLNTPIRKFFEIPAFGSLLVCKPFQGFEKLGFIDGENCLICDENNIDEIIDKVKDRDLVKKITLNGQLMIKEKHTSDVRVRQFYNIFLQIEQKNFKKFFWNAGDLFCELNDGSTKKM